MRYAGNILKNDSEKKSILNHFEKKLSQGSDL